VYPLGHKQDAPSLAGLEGLQTAQASAVLQLAHPGKQF
jgi:hypothetical protein